MPDANRRTDTVRSDQNEVTREMVEAGVDAFYGPYSPDDQLYLLIEEIYRAMAKVSLAAGGTHSPCDRPDTISEQQSR